MNDPARRHLSLFVADEVPDDNGDSSACDDYCYDCGGCEIELTSHDGRYRARARRVICDPAEED